MAWGMRGYVSAARARAVLWNYTNILHYFYWELLRNTTFLTSLPSKSTIFWDITPCTPLKVNRRFGATYTPEDGTLHNHRCENLKSYIFTFIL
jgi:hypothetical protein